MKRRAALQPMMSLLLMVLLVLLAPREAALAAQPCTQSGAMLASAPVVAERCDNAASACDYNSCDNNHSSVCCQAFCLLKARVAQSLAVPVVPVSQGWRQAPRQMPLPGHNRQLLHPPAG